MKDKTIFVNFEPRGTLWECQSCKAKYVIEGEEFIFCPNCGSQIDLYVDESWDDDEDEYVDDEY